jgi:hypothetical protein
VLRTGKCRKCGEAFTWNHRQGKPRTLCDRHMPIPTLKELLAVARQLGYRKVTTTPVT